MEKVQAHLVYKYVDEKTAEAIAAALEPDNLQAPKNIEIVTYPLNKEVHTKIKITGEMQDLLTTLDDLLFSTKVAERTLSIWRKHK